MENILKEILSEIKSMNGRMDNLDNRMDKLDGRMDNLDNHMDKLESEVSIIKAQETENTQLIKSLIHSSEVQNANIDKLMNTTAKIEGTLNAIKKDLTSVEHITSKNWNDITSLKNVIKG